MEEGTRQLEGCYQGGKGSQRTVAPDKLQILSNFEESRLSTSVGLECEMVCQAFLLDTLWGQNCSRMQVLHRQVSINDVMCFRTDLVTWY